MLDLLTVKQYCRVDYDDDDALLSLMLSAAIEELLDLIPGMNAAAMSARQKLLCVTVIKDLYDNRERDADGKKSASDKDAMRQSVRSMLLREFLAGVAL